MLENDPMRLLVREHEIPGLLFIERNPENALI